MPLCFLDEKGSLVKLCPQCGLLKNACDFHRHSSRPDGLHNWCKSCAIENSKRHYDKDRSCSLQRKRKSSSPEVFIRRTWQSGSVGRRHPVSIGPEYLIDLYKSQGGLCHWTGVPMTFSSPSPRPNTNISADRVDPTCGYSEGNVVLCCCFVNQMKRDLTEFNFIETCKSVAKNAEKIRKNQG